MTIKDYMTKVKAAEATGEYTGRDMVLGLDCTEDGSAATPADYTYVGVHVEDYGAALSPNSEDKSYVYEGDSTVKTSTQRTFQITGQAYEENLNKVDASFKENAQTVKDWAKTATEQFGMSESAALEAASLFGDMGTSMGLTTDIAADMSTGLAGLAGDLASFKNIGIDQAMTALKGVFTGETESLKTLGIVMTETNLKEFAKGLGLVYDEMSQAEKVTLRYKYVLANTKNAQGDYARTSDGTANSMRTLKSSVENLGAAFGQELLPEITPVIQKATELIKGFGDLDDSTKQSVIHLGMAAAAAGPAATGLGKITDGIGTAIEKAGKFTSALSGGGGLGSALVSTLGSSGMAGLAIAGTTALVGGTVFLASKISDAIDPVKQMERSLQDVSTAQEGLNASMNIIDLSGRYEELRAKLADTSLSASELADAEAEMNTVRSQLSQATNGAVSAEGELNSELDATVRVQKVLAEIEAQRAKQDLYDTLDDGAVKYRENLNSLKIAHQELAEAEAHMNASSQALTDGANAAYQDLQNTLDGIRSSIDDGLIDASTVDGAQALESALNGLEQKIYDLTGVKVEFAGLTEAETYMDGLSISTGDAANAADDAAKDYQKLSAETKRLEAATKAYEDGVISLVREGLLGASDACDLLSVSEEGLQHKIKNLESQEIAAAKTTENLAEKNLEAAEAAKEHADAEKAATQELGRIGIAAYQAISSSDDLRKSYDDLKKQLDDLKEAGDEDIRQKAEQVLAYLNLAATNQELSSSYALMGIDVGNSLTSMSGFLNETGISADEFASGVTSMRDSVVNDFQLIADSNKITADQMVANLEANLQTQQAWSNNLSELWKQAYADQDTSVMAFINYLANKGPEYASVVAEFANGGYSKLQEAAGSWSGIGEQSASDYAAGIWMQQYLSGEAGTAVGQGAIDAAGLLDYSGGGQSAGTDWASGFASTDGQGAGQAVMQSVVSGMGAQSGAVQSKAQELADAVTSTWKNADGKFKQSGETAGRSIKAGLDNKKSEIKTSAQQLADAVNIAWSEKSFGFVSSGSAAAASIAGGIASGQSGITSAASAAAGAAYGAFSAPNWYSLGYNISAGVASGVRGGSSLISRAATSAAQSALAAAKSTLGVHSPSRVFRDEIGRMIPAGIALGVEKGTPEAEKALKLSADQLLRATQIALRPSGNLSPAQSITTNTYYNGEGGSGQAIPVSVEVPLYVDGREFARATAKYTGQRMAYLGGTS